MEKLRILVAEDSKSIQLLYKQYLIEEVFDIRIVGDGKAAISEYKSWKPEIILLDVNMPEMTGYSALKEIREIIGDTSTVVVMQTSITEKDKIVEFIEIGIQGYLVKPFDPKTVAEKILGFYEEKDPKKSKELLDVLKNTPQA